MLEGVLYLCAFMTLVAVSSAAYVTCIGITIFYKHQQELKNQLATLPLRADKAINDAVSKFVEPWKKQQDGSVPQVPRDLMLPSEESREFADWLLGETD